MLELEADSSLFGGIHLAYLGCLHLISSREISSAGWIILLVAPVVAIVLTLPSLLLGVLVVGGALIVAAKETYCKEAPLLSYNKPDEIGLKSAPTMEAPGEEQGMALGKSGLAGPPCVCIIAICGGIIGIPGCMNCGPIGPIDIIAPIGRPGGMPGGGIIPDIIPGIPGMTPGAFPRSPSGLARFDAGSSSSSDPETVPETPPSRCLSCSRKSAAGIPTGTMSDRETEMGAHTFHSVNFDFYICTIG